MAAFLGITTDRDVGGNNGSSRLQAELLADLDTYSSELGAVFCEGIRPIFSAAMARHYDSWWNWARQDLVELFFDILCGKVSHSDIRSAPRCLRLANRLNPMLMDPLRYIVHCAQQGSSPGHKLAHKYGSSLIRAAADMCTSDSAFAPPAYQFTATLMAPRLRIGSPGGTFGSIEYTEIPRPSEKSISDFVDAVTSTLPATNTAASKPSTDSQRIHAPSDALDTVLGKLGLNQPAVSSDQPQASPSSRLLPPMVHLCSKPADDPTAWRFDPALSAIYSDTLRDMCTHGLSLVGKRALITGCGSGSIGAEVLKALLEAGASVVVTTSSYSRKVTSRFEQIYQRYGARDSSLVIVPFNQASRQDVASLVDYIYADPGA
ncbi:fatty acid synthase alpha subunit Lsd1, partial [Kickxella alabastrina]